MKFKQLASAVLCTWCMQSAFAADLGQDMDTLDKNFGIFKQSHDTQEALTALTNMQQAATDAKDSTPMKLIGQPDESLQTQNYQHALDSLVAEINQGITLVKAGNLAEAQAQVVPHIAMLKQQNHKKFR